MQHQSSTLPSIKRYKAVKLHHPEEGGGHAAPPKGGGGPAAPHPKGETTTPPDLKKDKVILNLFKNEQFQDATY